MLGSQARDFIDLALILNFVGTTPSQTVEIQMMHFGEYWLNLKLKSHFDGFVPCGKLCTPSSLQTKGTKLNWINMDISIYLPVYIPVCLSICLLQVSCFFGYVSITSRIESRGFWFLGNFRKRDGNMCVPYLRYWQASTAASAKWRSSNKTNTMLNYNISAV